MNNDFKQHISRLRSSGLRPTRQRLLISKVLFDRSDTIHFTIEKLKKIIKNNSKDKISTATLYNTIHAFEKNGYLKKLSLKDNKTFYDTNVSNHHHFYDNDSGSLVDIKNEDEIMVTISNYGVSSIWFTNDGGDNWFEKEGNLYEL